MRSTLLERYLRAVDQLPRRPVDVVLVVDLDVGDDDDRRREHVGHVVGADPLHDPVHRAGRLLERTARLRARRWAK